MTRVELGLAVFHAFACGFCAAFMVVAALHGWTGLVAMNAAFVTLTAAFAVVHLREAERTGPAQNERAD